MLKHTKLSLAIALISGTMLTGCLGGGGGGGSSSSSNPPAPPAPPALQQARFVDIEGIDVTAGELESASTGSGGSFDYAEDGDSVIFSIGDIELPEVDAKPTITPLDMSVDGASYDDRVVNIMRLLQTLDNDDEQPGIQISEAAKTAAASQSLDFDQSVALFENDPELINYLSALGETSLATEEAATRTLHCTLTPVGVSNVDTLIGAHVVSTDEGDVDALLVFSRDGSFYMAQLLQELEFDALLGYEAGSYSQLDNLVRFNINEDTNGTSGVRSDEDNGGPGACPSEDPTPFVLRVTSASATSATFETSTTPPETFSAQRILTSQGEMAGSWRLDDQDVVVVFNGDDLTGDYYLIEFGSSDEETRGIEAGTYSRSGNVVTPSTTIDTNGDGGLSDVGSFIIEIVGDTMTFTIDDAEGTEVVTFSRID